MGIVICVPFPRFLNSLNQEYSCLQHYNVLSVDRSQDPAVILTILTFYIHLPICRSWSVSRRGHSPISQWGKLFYDLLEVLLQVSDRGESEIQVPSSFSSSLVLLVTYQYCLNGSHAKKCLHLAEFQYVSGQTKLTVELTSAVAVTIYVAKLAFIFSLQWEFPSYWHMTTEWKSKIP